MTADNARKQSERQLSKLEKQIEKEYKEAQAGITEKWNKYMASASSRLSTLEEKYNSALKSGDADAIQAAKNALEKAKINATLTDKRYQAMIDDTTKRLASVNQIALSYVNRTTPNIYAINYNQIADQADKLKIDFTIVDESTVKKLITQGEIQLPKKKIDIPKDQQWNRKQLNSSVLQGILQGESMGKIAKRILPVVDNNQKAAIRNARTMVTGAENAGRLDSYKDLEDRGVIMKKVWIATNDDRTREWHLDMDGQEVDVNEPFVDELGNELDYPGDPSAAPETVYNCRCSMRTHIVGVRSIETVDEKEDIAGNTVEIFDREFSEQEIMSYVGKDDDTLYDMLTNVYSEEDINALLKDDDSFDVDKLRKFLFGEETAPSNYKALEVSEETLAVSPPSLAGVERGEVMTFNEANYGEANSHYGEDGCSTNCQSCVVAFEGRLRGYDVTAAALNKTSQKIAEEPRKAWIDPTTGKKPHYIQSKSVNDADSCFKWLGKKIQTGERYTLEFNWKGGDGGHIISAFKDNEGDVMFYDPQISQVIMGADIKRYLDKIDYKVITTSYTGSTECTTKLLRVDNLAFNEKVTDKILRKSE